MQYAKLNTMNKKCTLYNEDAVNILTYSIIILLYIVLLYYIVM